MDVGKYAFDETFSPNNFNFSLKIPTNLLKLQKLAY